jgi:hypothetical protein
MSVLDRYVGDYEPEPGAARLGKFRVTPGEPLRVFIFEEKPYLHLPGVGDVEMYPTARRGIFAVRAVLSMAIAFEQGADERVTRIAVTLGDYTVTASRAR